jgi:hypothetical protein
VTPFQRLALFAAGSLVAGLLCATALYLSPWLALGAGLGGALLGVLVTIEVYPTIEPTPAEEAEVRRSEPVERTVREITERRARRSREAEELEVE